MIFCSKFCSVHFIGYNFQIAFRLRFCLEIINLFLNFVHSVGSWQKRANTALNFEHVTCCSYFFVFVLHSFRPWADSQPSTHFCIRLFLILFVILLYHVSHSYLPTTPSPLRICTIYIELFHKVMFNDIKIDSLTFFMLAHLSFRFNVQSFWHWAPFNIQSFNVLFFNVESYSTFSLLTVSPSTMSRSTFRCSKFDRSTFSHCVVQLSTFSQWIKFMCCDSDNYGCGTQFMVAKQRKEAQMVIVWLWQLRLCNCSWDISCCRC